MVARVWQGAKTILAKDNLSKKAKASGVGVEKVWTGVPAGSSVLFLPKTDLERPLIPGLTAKVSNAWRFANWTFRISFGCTF